MLYFTYITVCVFLITATQTNYLEQWNMCLMKHGDHTAL